MNRRDFQNLADLRIREAEALFRARHFSGAYYLAGYALESGLKACIAKQFKRYEFPDKKIVNDAHSHDLRKLAGIARLEDARLLRLLKMRPFVATGTLLPSGRRSADTGPPAGQRAVRCSMPSWRKSTGYSHG